MIVCYPLVLLFTFKYKREIFVNLFNSNNKISFSFFVCDIWDKSRKTQLNIEMQNIKFSQIAITILSCFCGYKLRISDQVGSCDRH